MNRNWKKLLDKLVIPEKAFFPVHSENLEDILKAIKGTINLRIREEKCLEYALKFKERCAKFDCSPLIDLDVQLIVPFLSEITELELYCDAFDSIGWNSFFSAISRTSDLKLRILKIHLPKPLRLGYLGLSMGITERFQSNEMYGEIFGDMDPETFANAVCRLSEVSFMFVETNHIIKLFETILNNDVNLKKLLLVCKEQERFHTPLIDVPSKTLASAICKLTSVKIKLQFSDNLVQLFETIGGMDKDGLKLRNLFLYKLNPSKWEKLDPNVFAVAACKIRNLHICRKITPSQHCYLLEKIGKSQSSLALQSLKLGGFFKTSPKIVADAAVKLASFDSYVNNKQATAILDNIYNNGNKVKIRNGLKKSS